MGSQVTMPPAPPPPQPVDPGKAALDYTRSMADPEFQQLLLQSEKTYRPQYNELNLADYNTYLSGTDDQMGLLGLNQLATEAQTQQNIDAASAQRQADIADVSRLGPQATDAFMQANPALAAAMARATELGASQNIEDIGRGELGGQVYADAQGSLGLGATGTTLDQRAQELAQSTGKLSAQEMRDLEQGVRSSYASRGREMDNSAIGAESYQRLANTRQRMMEDLSLASALNQGAQSELGSNRAYATGVQQNDLARLLNNAQMRSGALGQDRSYGLSLAGMNQNVASDPFMAILGRPSTAPSMAQGNTQFASALTGSQQGSQLFDPNAGINLGLQNASNQADYQSSIYGAQAGFAGAQAQARGAMIGGALGGLGAAAGGAGGISKIFTCWVAREVYGNGNPKWLMFRDWLTEDAPVWFHDLYMKHGPAFAEFIKNKPTLKRFIRKWMDARIESKFAPQLNKGTL
jgi:hypothetical protein